MDLFILTFSNGDPQGSELNRHVDVKLIGNKGVQEGGLRFSGRTLVLDVPLRVASETTQRCNALFPQTLRKAQTRWLLAIVTSGSGSSLISSAFICGLPLF
jgi:hypothetical protein